MKKGLKLGKFELFRLNGGRFAIDGGAMFGVVPKVLWSKKYPCCDEENRVPLIASPILVKTPDTLVKLDEKQKRIFRLQGDWDILKDLGFLDIKREDIDVVILTHYDFDHAGGVVMMVEGAGPALTFPNARHILQETEWQDVLNPNRRSVNTYWPINYELLKKSGNLELVSGEVEVVDGIKAIHTGGHTRGHQVVRMESEGETALHMGDLLPLWVTAYDNFPLDAIEIKKELESRGIEEGSWFTFYHDPFIQACRFDEEGNVVEEWKG